MAALTIPIQVKTPPSAGLTPTSLLPGELALDHYIGRLWWADNNGVKQSIVLPGLVSSAALTAALASVAQADDVRQLMIQMAKLQGKVAGYASGFADDYADTSGVSIAETTQSLPAMTSDTTPAGYTITGSGENSSYPYWNAFSQHATSANTLFQFASATLPQSIQRVNPSAATYGSYSLTSRTDATSNTPTAWTLYGTNDNGNTLTQLDQQSGITFAAGQTLTFTIPLANRGSFTGHRWTFTGTSGGAISLNDISLFKAGDSSGFAYDATNKLFTNLTNETTQSLPAMTSDTAPSGYVASASSELSAGSQAWYAFNQNLGDYWHSNTGSSFPIVLTRQNPTAYTMVSYSLTGRNDSTAPSMPSAWSLLGSNDGSNWTTLDTRTSQAAFSSGETRTFTIASPGPYSYHRLSMTGSTGPGAGSYINIAEFQLFKQIFSAGDLRSVAAPASIVPSKAGIFVLVKPLNGGTITPNTNLVAYVTRTRSAAAPTWTQVTLVAAGTVGGFNVYEANPVDISGQPSGSSMGTRLVTSGGLAIQAQANVMQWSQ